MARTRAWRNGVLEAEDFPLGKVCDYLAQDDCVVWADLCAPLEGDLHKDNLHADDLPKVDVHEVDVHEVDVHEDVRQVAEELGLAPLAVEDALELHERPKLERYPSHQFLTTYGLSFDAAGALRQVKVSAFLLPRALVTVRHADFDIEAVVRAWDGNPELLEFGAPALLYGLLDVVVDGHLATVQQLDDRIEEVEDSLFDEQPGSPDVQRSTYELRKSLTGVRKVVLPMRGVVDALTRHHDPARADELSERYRDLADHVVRVNEWTDGLRELVTTIFETGLSLANARLNQVVRRLSAWAAIIAVPTAVTGFYGQNVPYPGFGQRLGFVVSTVVTMLLAGGFYATFKRRGWL